MNLSRHTIIFSICAGLLVLVASDDASAKHGTRFVNCDKGGSVAKALRFAPPGTRIFVRGTCQERIVIKRDHIRLKGLGNAGFEPPAESNPPTSALSITDITLFQKTPHESLDMRCPVLWRKWPQTAQI